MPGARIHFDSGKLGELADHFLPDGLTVQELIDELEKFLWANGITREEYLDQMIDRRGMGKPLYRKEREQVWIAAESIATELRSTKSYTKNLAALDMANRPDLSQGSMDYIFLDEAQDLSTSVLKALRSYAKISMILAGDSDQAIYQSGFSFRRAGVEIGGRSRILKTNFRNTLPIHRLAETFRSYSRGKDIDLEPEAFRDGPEPELFLADKWQGLVDILMKRIRLFTYTLGYSLENLCILVPNKKILGALRNRLSTEGFENSSLLETNFSFTSEGSIRLSTLHSAKGLDFPVVLVYVPEAPYFGTGYDPTMVDTLTRNLIYVALTRAMEHLNVFVLEDSGVEVFEELKGVFRG